MEQKNQATKSSTFREILVALRKNWIMILIIVVVMTAIGYFYGKFEKPVYTARHQAFYSTQNIVVEDPNSAEHINAARAYMDTVADFGNEEFVVKRADYLYGRYLKEKESNPDLTAKQFILNLDETDYKQYNYNELTSCVQSYVDVFFEKEVIENKKAEIRTYVFRGVLTERGEEHILVESPSGYVAEIRKTDYLYAVKTDVYQSEYTFNELVRIPSGEKVKIFTLQSAGANLPKEFIGTLVSVDNASCTIKSNDGVDIVINADNFKKATLVLESYFKANKIGVDYENGDNDTDESFFFTFKYTDDTPELAKDKVQFVIKSCHIEATRYLFDENKPIQAKFVLFKNVNVTIDGKAGFNSVTSSVNKIKTLIVFFAIGAVVAFVFAYLKETLDKTIKKKEDLEEITETKLLTVIPVEEDR